MSSIASVLALLGDEVGRLSAALGRRVDFGGMNVTDRSAYVNLVPPTKKSPNRMCHMMRASDEWIALNLARDEDRSLVPAWLTSDCVEHSWKLIEERVAKCESRDLVAQGVVLGLPVARVGELSWNDLGPVLLKFGSPSENRSRRPLKAVDLSALWAGPLCGALLAQMGASVVKVENSRRPDPTRNIAPEFYRNLNGAKSELHLDLSQHNDLVRLRREILDSDIVITSARPRAFASLGLNPEAMIEEKPGLVWVAITGHGWTGAGAMRVAFGDDAAAAGGLVRWSRRGTPAFAGDALADPVTGLVAAIGLFRGLLSGGGVMVDASLARCAAGAAVAGGFREAA